MTMRTLFPKLSLRGSPAQAIALSFLLGLSLSASAATYYRWVDDRGVTHYTSTPPQGVASEKVRSYSGSGSENTQDNSTSESGAAESETQKANEEKRLEVSQQDPERCEAARNRLEVLQSGRRIRMATEGGFRYLSQEEIQEEMALSQEAIADSC